jgi:signal transduction histidine kinase
MRRGSVRLRLTLLFGSLFLAAGAALLGITYGLVSHATNGIIVARQISGSGALTPATLPDPGVIQAQAVQTADQARTAEDDALLLYSGIALAIMAVASVAVGWFVAGRALRPLRRITAAARRISATNLHERLALDGPDDDLRELANVIDDLFGRLDASFDAQRQFVANASHELRTPLARSRTLLEVALRNPDGSSQALRTACERVLAAGEEQERLIEALLTLARSQRGIGRREPLDLAAITRDVLAARGTEIAASGLAMAVTLAPALMAGDFALSERAVANLIDNALRHNVADGSVRVTVGTDSGRAVLEVANTGPVIAPGEADWLLVPFHRGGAGAPRAAHTDGLGLGLPIVRAIATAHGASFSITPRSDGGLSARLVFPPVPRQPQPAVRDRDLEPAAAAGVNPAGLFAAGADFRPQGPVCPGGRTAGREYGDRSPLDRHSLNNGECGYGCGSHLRPFSRKIFSNVPVQFLSAVDHGKERHHVRLAAVEARDEVGELVERAHRKRGGNERDHDHVGGVQDVFRHQRDARRAVEENGVVFGGERG